jgi:hypothetical protein
MVKSIQGDKKTLLQSRSKINKNTWVNTPSTTHPTHPTRGTAMAPLGNIGYHHPRPTKLSLGRAACPLAPICGAPMLPGPESETTKSRVKDSGRWERPTLRPKSVGVEILKKEAPQQLWGLSRAEQGNYAGRRSWPPLSCHRQGKGRSLSSSASTPSSSVLLLDAVPGTGDQQGPSPPPPGG